MSPIFPPIHKNITTLNKDLFRKSLDLLALRVPSSSCSQFMKALSGNVLSLPRLKPIVEEPKASTSPENTSINKSTQPSHKLILLSHEITDISNLSQKAKEFLQSQQQKVEIVPYTVELDYSYWTAEQILHSILPEDLTVPTAFESIGHIAHLNLHGEYGDFKKIIGQVILDKNKYIRTVVNKTDNIDHTFRFFKMEVLAGDDDFIAEQSENTCRFKFDFSKVYWNSRLQAEHERMVLTFQPNELICDVFAGVGPFALPAAKMRQCVVFANDLNPMSYKWMVENIKSNKVLDRVMAYNMDGREFIRRSIDFLNDKAVIKTLRDHGEARIKGKFASKSGKEAAEKLFASFPLSDTNTSLTMFDHYVMNLPATAIEFLDAFRGLYTPYADKIADKSSIKLPTIHVHCFSKADDLENDVLERVESIIGYPLRKQPDANGKSYIVKVYRVRDVAPKKEMMCVSFRLPYEVAFEEPGHAAKRVKTEE